MKKAPVEVYMNPVRQRILQYLSLRGSGTASQLGAALSDIPKASLYRHIKVLSEAGAIEVRAETRVRGATERTYALAAPSGESGEPQALSPVFQNALLSLAASFAAYFGGADPDPARDMLSVSGISLMLTDAEYASLLQRVGLLFAEAAQTGPGAQRKPRSVALVSAPVIQKECDNV